MIGPDDIVERLRRHASHAVDLEAAAEIERLRAVLDTTQGLMSKNYTAGLRAGLERAAEIAEARAAEWQKVADSKVPHTTGWAECDGRACTAGAICDQIRVELSQPARAAEEEKR